MEFLRSSPENISAVTRYILRKIIINSWNDAELKEQESSSLNYELLLGR